MKKSKILMSLFTAGIVFSSSSIVSAEDIHFKNCSEAWANGYGDIKVGEPGYAKHLDREHDGSHDGYACELKNSRGKFNPKTTDGTPLNKVKPETHSNEVATTPAVTTTPTVESNSVSPENKEEVKEEPKQEMTPASETTTVKTTEKAVKTLPRTSAVK